MKLLYTSLINYRDSRRTTGLPIMDNNIIAKQLYIIPDLFLFPQLNCEQGRYPTTLYCISNTPPLPSLINFVTRYPNISVLSYCILSRVDMLSIVNIPPLYLSPPFSDELGGDMIDTYALRTLSPQHLLLPPPITPLTPPPPPVAKRCDDGSSKVGESRYSAQLLR